MPEDVNDQVTDGVTQANFSVLGTGPSMAVVQTELSLAQAQGTLFANMVSNQQNLALSTNAAMAEGIMQMLSGGGGGGKVVATSGGAGNPPPPPPTVNVSPMANAFNVQPEEHERHHEDRYDDAIMSLMVR